MFRTFNIEKEFINNKEIDLMQLKVALRKRSEDVADSTISWYINQLVEKSVISRIGRGKYVLNEKNIFNPTVSKRMKKLNKKIKTEFPFVVFCIYETYWLNSFSTLQQMNNFTIIEVEKGTEEAIFHKLSETYKNIFLNPDFKTFDLYISSVNEAIIIKPLISQSPLKEIEGLKIPEIEKLLIDILANTNVYSAQQNEIENIYYEVFERFNINISKLKRYGKRRNKASQALKIINQIMTNKD